MAVRIFFNFKIFFQNKNCGANRGWGMNQEERGGDY